MLPSPRPRICEKTRILSNRRDIESGERGNPAQSSRRSPSSKELCLRELTHSVGPTSKASPGWQQVCRGWSAENVSVRASVSSGGTRHCGLAAFSLRNWKTGDGRRVSVAAFSILAGGSAVQAEFKFSVNLRTASTTPSLVYRVAFLFRLVIFLALSISFPRLTSMQSVPKGAEASLDPCKSFQKFGKYKL